MPRLPSWLVYRLDAFRKRSLPLPVAVAEGLPVLGSVRRTALGRAARTAPPGGLRRVRSGRRTYLAGPLPGPDLTEVTRRNLDTVVGALDDAGIDYVVVPNEAHHATVVAVREPDRAAMLRAMREAWAGEPVYVQLARRDCLSFEPAVLARRALDTAAAHTVGVLRVFRVYSAGSFTVADDMACDVEVWQEDERSKSLLAPRDNRVSRTLPMGALSSTVTVAGRPYRGIEPLSVVTPTDVGFPVDLVYTWVDGADPAWAARRDRYLGVTDPSGLSTRAADAARYLNRDELRYSLRSVEMFAPWVRHIHLVTDGQVPAWLDTSHPRIRLVDHRDIFTDPSVLPTFNSHAIESQLHHIEGLAEHYVYLNDDMLLGRPVLPTTFFHANGLAKMFLSPARVEYGTPTPEEKPVTAAAKNNRRLILRDFGRYVTQKQKHAPYPHRRSVMDELEERYAEEFARTAASRFRHPGDISVAASLQQYYGFLTGRTVPASIAYSYVDLADGTAPAKLAGIRERRRVDAYCVNDTDADGVDLEEQLRTVRAFFESFYPVPASWERPGGTGEGVR